MLVSLQSASASVLEAQVNRRGQTRLRLPWVDLSGRYKWQRAVSSGTTLLESVPEEETDDDVQSNEPEIDQAAVNLLYDPPSSCTNGTQQRHRRLTK